jgi:hypothetical protein
MLKESKTFTIVSPFYGYKLREPVQEFKLGNYTICTKKHIMEEYHDADEIFESKIRTIEGMVAEIDNYYICNTKIEAESIDEAKSKFMEGIENLINVLLYLIPKRDPENGKIKIALEHTRYSFIVKEDSKTTISHSKEDLINPLYIIDDKLFSFPGNDIRLFDYLATKPTTHIEKRIHNAVSWIGQAAKNLNLTEGFLELSIAFETLLVFQDGFISKSITAQLAEDTAFLISDAVEERKAIYKRIKDLYQKRSSIVHSTKVDIQLKDYYDLLEYLKLIIEKYFTLLDEEKIKNLNEIREYLDDAKFK